MGLSEQVPSGAASGRPSFRRITGVVARPCGRERYAATTLTSFGARTMTRSTCGLSTQRPDDTGRDQREFTQLVLFDLRRDFQLVADLAVDP